MPFLKALMPWATSPISSEILPRPNSRSRTAMTTIQCQMLRPPMEFPPSRRPARANRLVPRQTRRRGRQKQGFRASRSRDRFARAGACLTTTEIRFSFLVRAGGQSEVEISGLERVLVLPQARIVRRHRNRKARRQASLEQAGALELVEAREVADRVETEMAQKCVGGPERDRPPRRLAAAARPDPAGLEQHVERAPRGGDAADLLDLRPGDRLVVGDD